MTGNVLDYWARVVGLDVVLTGNHSQTAIEYRSAGRVKHVANLPDPVEF